jgi:hypothetical protein
MPQRAKTNKDAATPTEEQTFNLDPNQCSIVEQINSHTEKMIDKLQTQMQDMINKINEQYKMIVDLQCDVDIHKKRLDEKDIEIARLKEQVTDILQDKVANNVEIHGYPQQDGENLGEIVCKVAEVVGAPETALEENLASVYRGRRLKHKPAPIIVCFKNENAKNLWMNGRKRKEFKSYDVPITFSEKVAEQRSAPSTRGAINRAGASEVKKRPLQIFEQLVPDRRQLLFDTRRTAFDLGYKFVWSKNGKIFVRKNAESKALIRIMCKDDIVTKLTLGEGANPSKNQPHAVASAP